MKATPQQIIIKNSFAPSTKSADLQVYFDIFRSTTSLLCILDQGPSELISVGEEVDIEPFLKSKYLFISEKDDKAMDDSPMLITGENFSNKKVVHQSTDLFTAIKENLKECTALIGGFCNLRVLADYIIQGNFNHIELIAVSSFYSKEESIEDISAAKMLKGLLENKNDSKIPNIDKINHLIYTLKQTSLNVSDHYWADINYCLHLNTTSSMGFISVKEDLLTNDSVIYFQSS